MNRTILVSLVIIGTITALAGGSTLALFNDTETSSDNTFTAGALDLKIDYEESYNGEVQETQTFTDNPGAIFNLSDIKPGDTGSASISMHVFDNPAYVNMSLNQTANSEISCTEPESIAEGGDCGTEGELGENLDLLLWYDDGDNEYQDGEEVIFNGTAEELESAGLPEGVPVDFDPSTDQIEPFENSTTRYVGVQWSLPIDVGNEVQTDEKKFDFEFYAEQARHNSYGDGEDDGTGEPQTEDAYYQADLAEGPVIQDLSQTTYNSRDYDNNGAQDMAAWMHGGPGMPVDNESVTQNHLDGNCVDPGDDATDVWNVDTSADTATAEFTVLEECEVTLVSYIKPYPGWIGSRADEQIVFDNVTTTLESGQHSLTVDIPNAN